MGGSIAPEYPIKKNKNQDICIHISCHGNDEGIWFGDDFIEWPNLLYSFKYVLFKEKREGKTLLFLSACGTENQTITKFLKAVGEQSEYIPIDYILLFNESSIEWNTAIISWSIVYYTLSNDSDDEDMKIDRKIIQKAIKSVKAASLDTIELKYYRWDKKTKKYIPFSAK